MQHTSTLHPFSTAILHRNKQTNMYTYDRKQNVRTQMLFFHNGHILIHVHGASYSLPPSLGWWEAAGVVCVISSYMSSLVMVVSLCCTGP